MVSWLGAWDFQVFVARKGAKVRVAFQRKGAEGEGCCPKAVTARTNAQQAASPGRRGQQYR